MSKKKYVSLTAFFAIVIGASVSVAAPFKIFMISSTAVDHLASSAMARAVLPQMGMTNDFTVDATTDNTLINEANLAKYDVFLQMHLAPFEIKLEQRAALENFVKSGKGWVGVHAAGLIILSEIGPGKALPDWPFFDDLMGHVTWITHPMLQMGRVIMEDRTQPMTRNMPAMFTITDEWYEFSGNPRANVHVLGRADENSYRQVKPMGDHPLIWICDKFPKAIYIGTGHDASDFQNAAWTGLLRDSLLWAAGRLADPSDGGTDATDGPAGDGGSDSAAEGGGGDGNSDAPRVDAAADATVDASTEAAAAEVAGSGGATGSGGAAATGGASGSGGTKSSSDGCSCRVSAATEGAGTTATPGLSSLVLAGLGLVARRRRRRR
jgi:type 1 glutamine amidotransferase